MSGIGVLREGPLHAALKRALACPGDRTEVPLGRYVIDIVRADGELVEIQTGGFGGLTAKLDALLDRHRIRVVHPIAGVRGIVRVDPAGEVLATRASPKRATALELFDKLVAGPALLGHPNLTLAVVRGREDHLRGPAPVRVRRRTRDPGSRRLRAVLGRIELRSPEDLLGLLPPLPEAAFTTRELAAAAGCQIALAQRAVYCLRTTGLLEPAGQRGRAPLHRPTCSPATPA